MSEIIPNEVKQEPMDTELELEKLDLDPDGDIILVIEGQNAKKFLVSSKILSLASPVFSKMLGPNFHEGMQMTDSNCLMISLHDDDPLAMETMLKIFHYKGPNLGGPMTAERLAVLAIHCDKYDCFQALKSWIHIWFSNFGFNLTAEGYGFLMLAAHVSRGPNQFSKWSKMVQIKFSPSSLAKWEGLDMLGFLPDDLRDDLTGRMEKSLCQIHGELQNVERFLSDNQASYMFDVKVCMTCGETYASSSSPYSCHGSKLIPNYCTTEHRIAKYFAVLRESGLWPSLEPFQSCSAEEIASRITLARDRVKGHNCQGGHCPLKQGLGNLVKRVNMIIGEVKGLPLYPLHPESTE